jgi:lipopolysaccharide transport system permease protein
LVYFLGAAGVFIRDIRNLVQLFLMIGVFVHPILYVPGMLPRWGEFIFALSPFSYVIWLYRDVLLGSIEHPVSWAIAPALGVAFLVLGFRFFRGMSHMFGDAL